MNERLLQAIVFTLLVTGLVVLIMGDKDTTQFVNLVGPIAVSLLVFQVKKRSDHQDEVLHEIHENTNGVLEGKIRKAVSEALKEPGR